VELIKRSINLKAIINLFKVSLKNLHCRRHFVDEVGFLEFRGVGLGPGSKDVEEAPPLGTLGGTSPTRPIVPGDGLEFEELADPRSGPCDGVVVCGVGPRLRLLHVRILPQDGGQLGSAKVLRKEKRKNLLSLQFRVVPTIIYDQKDVPKCCFSCRVFE